MPSVRNLAKLRRTALETALAFARCKHPKWQRLQLDADAVATGYRPGTRGLLYCCHCGAHRRSSDRRWVVSHLAATAIHAVQIAGAK